MNFRDKNLDCVNYDNDNGVCSMHHVTAGWCTDVYQFEFSSEGCFKFGHIFKLPTQTQISCADNLTSSPRRRQIIVKQFQVFSCLPCIDSCRRKGLRLGTPSSPRTHSTRHPRVSQMTIISCYAARNQSLRSVATRTRMRMR